MAPLIITGIKFLCVVRNLINDRIAICFTLIGVRVLKKFFFQFVDGWELNGEFFPNPMDHLLPMQSRFSEFCGKRKIKQVFLSSQNVALIQYRMPSRGSRFSFSVRFVKNPTRKYLMFFFFFFFFFVRVNTQM